MSSINFIQQYLLSFLAIILISSCNSSINKEQSESITDSVTVQEKIITYDLGLTPLEKLITQAIPKDFYLARNKEGYEYVRNDYNGDNSLDVVALITSQPNYEAYSYDQDQVKLAYFTGEENNSLKLKSTSQNIGAFSIEKTFRPKKLTQKGDTVTYEFVAMRYSDFFHFRFSPDHNDFILLEKVHCDPSCKTIYHVSENNAHELSTFNEDLIFEF